MTACRRTENRYLPMPLGRLICALALASLAVVASVGRTSAQVADDKIYTFVLFDELEYQQNGNTNPFRWDAEGWVGGDYDRLWFKTEGEQLTSGGGGEAEVQALYSRLISAFWDLQVGARLDVRYGEADHARGLIAFGVEGLAPYWFDVEASLFVSHKGDVSFRTTATYDLLFSQRLIGQPRFELNAAVQDVPEFGVGSGLNDIGLGWRLRYELRREFAPYLGISWIQRLGGTADLARAEGADTSEFALVGGVRVWF